MRKTNFILFKPVFKGLARDPLIWLHVELWRHGSEKISFVTRCPLMEYASTGNGIQNIDHSRKLVGNTRMVNTSR
jgi:hypothetical protein